MYDIITVYNKNLIFFVVNILMQNINKQILINSETIFSYIYFDHLSQGKRKLSYCDEKKKSKYIKKGVGDTE